VLSYAYLSIDCPLDSKMSPPFFSHHLVAQTVQILGRFHFVELGEVNRLLPGGLARNLPSVSAYSAISSLKKPLYVPKIVIAYIRDYPEIGT